MTSILTLNKEEWRERRADRRNSSTSAISLHEKKLETTIYQQGRLEASLSAHNAVTSLSYNEHLQARRFALRAHHPAL